jgi:predicted kinase
VDFEIIDNPTDKSELDRLRNPTESLQWNVAERALSLGVDVILENGFWSREERDKIHAKGKALGAKVELHYHDVCMDELAKRLETRNQNLPPSTFIISRKELELWASWFEPPFVEELAQYDVFREES